MLFNSIDFAIFLPIVFTLFWFVTNRRLLLQNLLIVASSFLFYGWWDWRFLSLIIFSIVVDFYIGLALGKQDDKLKRKFLLWISIGVNIGFLAFFKYFNFFVDNFVSAFTFFGAAIKIDSLKIVLPVGISFYTFQTLSYTVDVYRRKLEPAKNIIAFAAFVSFFPQLVAGPIERATNLLPQFLVPRKFNYSNAVDGLRQMLWGLFKKIVIADNCAEFANLIFNNSENYPGSTLFLGALFFTFQIYCDFSGYSDIAIGTSRLFGVDLMRNFAYPYFSRDIAEFWRRWHISLSTWFRDYVYIPLGGSKVGMWGKVRNTFIVFVLSGLWHGANWTFIVWGLLNAIYFLPLLLTGNNRNNLDIVAQGNVLPTLKELTSIILTFGLTVFAWIFFRAKDIEHAINFIAEIFSPSFFSAPDFNLLKASFITIVFTISFILFEWNGREQTYAIAHLGLRWKRPFRYAMYYALIFAIFWFGGKEQEFIYFQF